MDCSTDFGNQTQFNTIQWIAFDYVRGKFASVNIMLGGFKNTCHTDWEKLEAWQTSY